MRTTDREYKKILRAAQSELGLVSMAAVLTHGGNCARYISKWVGTKVTLSAHRNNQWAFSFFGGGGRWYEVPVTVKEWSDAAAMKTKIGNILLNETINR